MTTALLTRYFLSCIATLLFSDFIAPPAPFRCSSRVWVFPTSILQSKISRCIYVCIACRRYESSRCAFQIWKSFCNQDRQLSSSTWSGRFFSAQKISCLHPQQAGWVGSNLQFFESNFTNPTSKTLVGLRPNPIFSTKLRRLHILADAEQANFLRKNLFYENSRWFIQYCIKPELLLPVLKVKSGSNSS